MFWDQVLDEGWFRQRWRRWRNAASAAVQLVILALVVVALAEPRRSRPEHIVLVVNNAAPVKPGQPPLEGSKETAALWIAALNDYDEMAILSAARTPTVSSGWTSDRAKLREALDSIPAVDAASEMPATLALADWMTTGRPGARVVPLDPGGGTTAANPPRPCVPLWLFFAGAALVLCAVEWCLYQRRWIS